MILNITAADFIALFAMGFICSLIFLICGIMLVVTKNTNLIAKDTSFKEEGLFAKIYGWIYIISSILATTVLILALILKDLQFILFLILGIIVVTTLITQFLLQRKFKIKK